MIGRESTDDMLYMTKVSTQQPPQACSSSTRLLSQSHKNRILLDMCGIRTVKIAILVEQYPVPVPGIPPVPVLAASGVQITSCTLLSHTMKQVKGTKQGMRNSFCSCGLKTLLNVGLLPALPVLGNAKNRSVDTPLAMCHFHQSMVISSRTHSPCPLPFSLCHPSQSFLPPSHLRPSYVSSHPPQEPSWPACSC